jgi:hypothetical protein
MTARQENRLAWIAILGVTVALVLLGMAEHGVFG